MVAGAADARLDRNPQEESARRAARGCATAAVVAAIVAAFALAAVLALAIGDDAPTSEAPPPPAAVESTIGTQPGVRSDGGPEEGGWRAVPASPGRPDGGPEEGTRGPGH